MSAAAARQFRSIMASLSLAGISTVGPMRPMPAALTKMRMSGSSSCRVLRRYSISPGRVRSSASTRMGTALMDCSASSRSRRRAMAQISSTLPCSAIWRTNSRPKPLEAPVTNAIFMAVILNHRAGWVCPGRRQP